MLWTVRYLWPYGAYFLNCNCQHSYLVLRRWNEKDNIIPIRESVIQGYLLAIVAYGIEILPLIRHLKLMYSDVTQPWYADNNGALGMFDHLENYFKTLNYNGLERGYLPDTTKSILVVHP